MLRESGLRFKKSISLANFKPSFNVIVSAMSESGKTNLLQQVVAAVFVFGLTQYNIYSYLACDLEVYFCQGLEFDSLSCQFL